MRRIVFVLFLSLLPGLENANAATPAYLWDQHFGGTSVDHVRGVAVDPSGNVFVVGEFVFSITIGGTTHTSAGNTDVILIKYGPNGAPVWSQRFGSTGYDYGYSVATDASGNVFVGGTFAGTVSFGGAGLVSAGGSDIFVARYNTNGVHQWSQRFGSTGSDAANSLATDPAGNVVVGGEFTGSVNFGGGSLTSAGGLDIFFAKYDANGVHQWSKRFGGVSQDRCFGVATDPSSYVMMTGFFDGSVNFGGATLVSSTQDIYVAKYRGDGSHIFSKKYGAAQADYGYSVAADGFNNVFVTGFFIGTVDFGGGALTSAPGTADAFLLKLDSAGAHVWSRKLGSGGTDTGNGVAADAAGNVVVTGYFNGTMDMGGGNVTSTETDIFLARYRPDGSHAWSTNLGGFGYDLGYAVASDPTGGVLLGGGFEVSMDAGGGIFYDTGLGDGVVVKFGDEAAEPVITSVTDIPNDQGRKVKIRFNRSGADDIDAVLPVTRYIAYRRDDPAPAVTAGGRVLLDDGWTEVGSVSGFGKSTYGIDVPTIGDSTQVLGQYFSAFFIRAARDTPPIVFFDSEIDSGYSVDNLAPGIPGSLLYNSGVLSWNESPAEDFDYFTVYGAAADDFGSATVVDYTITPGMDVTASPYVFYFVTATDFSGNEGAPISVSSASGTGGTPRSYVLSLSNYPNPFNPRTSVAYTVPARGNVTVAIYDARGARVAALVNNEARDAGAYRVDWAGRNDHGAVVPSGIYFARIEQAGSVRTRKMVLLK